MATEKSPLPAIIVTPSSPSSSHDFSIAFLAPPPKPSLAERISALTSFQAPVQLRARTTIIFFLMLFILVCHVVTHRLAAQRPHLEFSVESGKAHVVDTWTHWLKLRAVVGVATSNAQETLKVVGTIS
jgi:hypothetical protein